MVNNDEQCNLQNGHRASSSKEEDNFFSDELLIEILCRLPSSKYAIQCKCICKRWSALISDSYFVGRFIASKLPCLEHTVSNSRIIENKLARYDGSNTCSDKLERSFVIIVRNLYGESWKGLMMHLEDPVFNLGKFSLSSLPCSIGENGATVTVVAAHNDLLVYCREASDSYYYYICNTQTRQWLSLPSTPFHYGQYVSNGFICHPYYSFEGGNVIFNPTYKFTIVVAHCPNLTRTTSELKIHLFSSNYSHWTSKVLVLPRPCKLLSTNSSFAFGGKLHIVVLGGIISFDPCGVGKDQVGSISCHHINLPPGFFVGNLCVGVRQGQLQVGNFDRNKLFTSWVLKDYETGEWSLVHKIALCQWVACGSFVSQGEKMREWPGSVVGQHPSNPDIIYVCRPRSGKMCSVLMCNTKTRRVKLAFHVPKSMRIMRCLCVFSSSLPVWPTPLPAL